MTVDNQNRKIKIVDSGNICQVSVIKSYYISIAMSNWHLVLIWDTILLVWFSGTAYSNIQQKASEPSNTTGTNTPTTCKRYTETWWKKSSNMNLCTRTLCVKLNLLPIDPDDPRHIPWSIGFDKDWFVSPGDIVVMVEIWSLESLDGGYHDWCDNKLYPLPWSCASSIKILVYELELKSLKLHCIQIKFFVILFGTRFILKQRENIKPDLFWLQNWFQSLIN